MAQKTVGDLMHKGVIACGPETTMDEVVRIVNDTSVHAILVMDAESRSLGMVSHMEIIQLYSRDLSAHLASEVMSDPSMKKVRKKIDKVTRKMFKSFPAR